MPRQLYDWRAHLSESEAARLARLEARREAAKVSISDVVKAIHSIKAKAYQRARHHATKGDK